MRRTFLAAAFALTTISAGSVAAAPAGAQEPLDAQTLSTIRGRFSQLMELANRHDLQALLAPDYSRLKVVGLTRDVAESYAPMNITVSYAGQDGTPKPFLMIIEWIKVGKDWKVASEIILPVPPTPGGK
jgi:hypothetical protein